jgi:hypothetical protein
MRKRFPHLAFGGRSCDDFAMGRARSLVVLGFALGLACEEMPAAKAPGAGAREGPSLARSVCLAECARTIRCEGPRASACDCDSVRDSDLLRPDWARAQIACLARTACGPPNASEGCESEAYRAIGAAPLSWPTAVMRCLERGDRCGGSFSTCRRLAAMSDDAQAQASVCFDQPCDAYATCFRDFFAARVAPAMHVWK